MPDTKTTTTTITAPPGWYVAFFSEGGEDAATGKKRGDSFILEPIVAWEITREEGRRDPRFGGGERWVHHMTTPLTLTGGVESTLAGTLIIKTPDGTFDFVIDRTCDTEAAALAYARELHDWEEDRRAKAKAAAGQTAWAGRP